MTEPDDVAPAPPQRRKHLRVVRPAPEQASVGGLSADERGTGWSEPEDTSREAEMLRDVPPHWGTKGS